MIHFHDFVYSIPQAFIEEDDVLPVTPRLDEDYWQQIISLDPMTKISLWMDDGEHVPPAPTLHIDEDYWQRRLHLTVKNQISLW